MKNKNIGIIFRNLIRKIIFTIKHNIDTILIKLNIQNKEAKQKSKLVIKRYNLLLRLMVYNL